ncbi:hypothetical protein BGX31_004806 [Mortierella sp. GBA43]|nr:hypothetical protein BGX31_004806 [Mortierella sp. GBA43]
MSPIFPWRKSHALARDPCSRPQTQHQERIESTDLRPQTRDVAQKHIIASPGSPQGVVSVATHVSPVATQANISMPINDARQWLLQQTGPSSQQQHHENHPLQPVQLPQNAYTQPAPQPLTTHGPQQQSGHQFMSFQEYLEQQQQQQQPEFQSMSVQEYLEQQRHEVSSSEHESVQDSPRHAQDGPHGSSELGWTIYEDPTDHETPRVTNPHSCGSQPFEKVGHAFSENKVRSRKKDLNGLHENKDSDDPSDNASDKENVLPGWQQEVEHEDDHKCQRQGSTSPFELDGPERGVGTQSDDRSQNLVGDVRGTASSSAHGTGESWRLLIEMMEWERLLNLEQQDLKQRVEEHNLHRAEFRSVREKWRAAAMEERQAQAQDMLRKRKRPEDEDQTDDAKVARARIESQQTRDHPIASTSSSHHRSRQAQATSRPSQRRALARTNLQQQQHPTDRVYAPAPLQHYDQPQEHINAQVMGELGESPSRPIVIEDEAPEEEEIAPGYIEDEAPEEEQIPPGYIEDEAPEEEEIPPGYIADDEDDEDEEHAEYAGYEEEERRRTEEEDHVGASKP